MARYTDLSLVYEGREASNIGTVESFTYVDEAENNADNISITIDNVDKRWANGWTPKLNDKIAAKIAWTDENNKKNKIDCGSFAVDDFSISSSPLICQINATIKPIKNEFSITPKSKIWKDVSVKQIATEITNASNLNLVYDSEVEDKIKELEQSNQTDSAFLKSLCEKYGLSLKVYDTKAVIYDVAKYEDKNTIAKISPIQCTQWSYNNSILGTYTGAVFSYTNSKDNKTISVTVGKSDRLLYINESADDEADAMKKAIAKVNASNRDLITISLELVEPMVVVATNCVDLFGFGGEIDGKYFITRVTHTISGNGYGQSLSLRKVVSRIGVGGEEDGQKENTSTENNSAADGMEYTVKKGDNLWNLAKKYLGKGVKMREIYEANKDVIEKEAKRHGKKDSDSGHWILEGTKLNIPGGKKDS
ncbi:LysM peptidoglycan-binding domain-containing protein [Lachnoanaerobaculum umeaense]|uniref:LysM peptidoglycan-binding domain-containing protein n=1 Tax=Lachnoanaerobaculum umeaense TaxID=617123 RepID=A0A385Q3K1_9FIRM|nr:LysM peptidoglycan-binding domain-containing protein [Lachnoanaerobaculum umeaense]AYB00208.1 LysM peptidoglycan-binding domain-containing protein [Lachnoanaerobaculum umeaense]PZW96757.1 hypothetical protein C7439_11184 [Lachnoanaerobaculum umeaense]DAN67338.1 MAG TPA: tail protein [Caudoviricetes sp.]